MWLIRIENVFNKFHLIKEGAKKLKFFIFFQSILFIMVPRTHDWILKYQLNWVIVKIQRNEWILNVLISNILSFCRYWEFSGARFFNFIHLAEFFQFETESNLNSNNAHFWSWKSNFWHKLQWNCVKMLCKSRIYELLC